MIHLWEGTFTVESGQGRGKSGCVQCRGKGGGRFPHQWYKSQQGEDIPGICLALLSLHCPNLSLSVLRNVSSLRLPELPSHGIAIDARKQVSGPSAALADSGVLPETEMVQQAQGLASGS